MVWRSRCVIGLKDNISVREEVRCFIQADNTICIVCFKEAVKARRWGFVIESGGRINGTLIELEVVESSQCAHVTDSREGICGLSKDELIASMSELRTAVFKPRESSKNS